MIFFVKCVTPSHGVTPLRYADSSLKVIGGKYIQSWGAYVDNFTHQGQNGNHICLVFEAMGLSALNVYRALPGTILLPLLKRACTFFVLFSVPGCQDYRFLTVFKQRDAFYFG
jgi:hypothetical protein